MFAFIFAFKFSANTIATIHNDYNMALYSFIFYDEYQNIQIITLS